MERSLTNSIRTLVAVVLLICVVSVLGITLPGIARELALVPREPGALLGVITMPLVHASFNHLLLNLPPFIVLSVLILLNGSRYYLITTAFITVIGGLGLWLLGRAGFHVGASGLIFGFLGFLLARGFYDARLGPVLIAATTAIFYGGLLWGVLPTQPGVSWDGHLAGLAAGVVTSRIVLSTLRLPTR